MVLSHFIDISYAGKQGDTEIAKLTYLNSDEIDKINYVYLDVRSMTNLIVLCCDMLKDVDPIAEEILELVDSRVNGYQDGEEETYG